MLTHDPCFASDQQVGDPENPGTWGNWTEPAVWTGLKEDVNEDGTVKQSYTAGWTTSTGHVGENWIGTDLNTSSYDLGSWQIYDADCCESNGDFPPTRALGSR